MKIKRRTAIVRAGLVCLMAPLLGGMACGQPDAPVAWGYSGAGAPEYWASLSDEYATCASGRQQSPVDIAGYVSADAPPISFDYRGGATSIRYDGLFVHAEFGPRNTMKVGQRIYALKSAHFHSPSEHLVDGESFAAELHLVHADSDGNLAVVGLLHTLGAPNPAAQELLDASTPEANSSIEDLSLDAALFMPGDVGHYRYDGSKTTPPCDEPVDWYVMRHPQTISQAQVDSILKLSGGPNNRPVQPLSDRRITVSP